MEGVRCVKAGNDVGRRWFLCPCLTLSVLWMGLWMMWMGLWIK